MVDYQAVSIVLTGIGLIIALTYYALQIRNQNRTRTAQLLMQVYSRLDTPEKVRALQEVFLWEFKDFDEWREKYWNPEDYNKLGTLVLFFGGAGTLVKTGDLPIEKVSLLMGSLVTLMWEKFDPIKEEIREFWDMPSWAHSMEYLYHEVVKHNAKNR
jgi:hypothetical protein